MSIGVDVGKREKRRLRGVAGPEILGGWHDDVL